MYDIAFVGTGPDPEDPDVSGYAMAYHHANAYAQLDNCRLLACADIVPENAAAFADTYEIAEDQRYEDFEVMLEEADPDIVSVCVPPAIHSSVVVDCAQYDISAIHCEKPMDLTWGGARQMAETCWRQDVQLTFNHQRRFKPSWVRGRELVESGEIGELVRVETTPPNIYDWGTHAIDFVGDLTGDRPAEWVIGQIDYRSEQFWFGAHNENQAQAQWVYDNGIVGLISTGIGADVTPAIIRAVGTEGVVDIGPRDEDDDSVNVRWRRDTGDWQREAVEEGEWTEPIDDAIAHIVQCLEDGTEPELSAKKALNSTEIIFGIWESSRRRGRVDFPLEIADNPLQAMVESGELALEDPE